MTQAISWDSRLAAVRSQKEVVTQQQTHKDDDTLHELCVLAFRINTLYNDGKGLDISQLKQCETEFLMCGRDIKHIQEKWKGASFMSIQMLENFREWIPCIQDKLKQIQTQMIFLKKIET